MKKAKTLSLILLFEPLEPSLPKAKLCLNFPVIYNESGIQTKYTNQDALSLLFLTGAEVEDSQARDRVETHLWQLMPVGDWSQFSPHEPLHGVGLNILTAWWLGFRSNILKEKEATRSYSMFHDNSYGSYIV